MGNVSLGNHNSTWGILFLPNSFPFGSIFCSHLSAVFGLYFLTIQFWTDSDTHPQHTAALLGADMRPNVASYLIDTLLVEE